MATIFDCSEPAGILTGMRLARAALGRGELVVLPTDTVYGLAADAFNPAAVQRLLEAKGRGRQSPPPVLIPTIATLEALAEHVSDEVRALTTAFWPGALTVIVAARETLRWDLGDTNGTVALRMPNNVFALELLAEIGPLAVSSANLTGQAPATTIANAEKMLGNSVSVYLDGGEVGLSFADAALGSTIVDATGDTVRVVRHGVISEEQIRAVLETIAPSSTSPTVPPTSQSDPAS